KPVRWPGGRRKRLADRARSLFEFRRRVGVASMSDVAIHSGAGAEGAFNPRTMLIVTAIGALAFIAVLILGAYAPDLRSGRNGGGHGLSNAAVGFSGLVRLADETGRKPTIVRSISDLSN